MKINRLELAEQLGGNARVFSFEADLDSDSVVAGDGVIAAGIIRINRVQQLAAHAERLGLPEEEFKHQLHEVINEHLHGKAESLAAEG